MKLLFWSFVGIDAVALVIGGLLGLAAAGPSRTSPLASLVIPVVIPAVILASAIGVFTTAQSAGARMAALVVAALPVLVVIGGSVQSLARLSAYRDSSGEIRQFRTESLRALEGAIERNDVAAVIAAAPGAKLDTPSLSGASLLVLSLRNLAKAPEQLEIVRALLAAGADPNVKGAEPPLQPAIGATRSAGLDAVRLLLEAGADPNALNELDEPAFFIAGGAGIDVAVMQLLLDHGADPKQLDRNGRSAVVTAATTRNWPVLELLLKRGAPWRDQRCSGGMPFQAYVEDAARSSPGDRSTEVLALLQGGR